MTQPVAIELAAYSQDWPQRFAAEQIALSVIFPAPTFRIEHIGSTSVPGLVAKPIIDILLGAPTIAQIEARIPAIEANGYRYRPEFETVLPQRRYFVKPTDSRSTFHVHAVELESAFWVEHLLFRDALRALPALAEEYGALKHQLASRHRDDRGAYAEAKAPFIRSAIERARAQLALTTAPR